MSRDRARGVPVWAGGHVSMGDGTRDVQTCSLGDRHVNRMNDRMNDRQTRLKTLPLTGGNNLFSAHSAVINRLLPNVLHPGLMSPQGTRFTANAFLPFNVID